MNDTKLETVLAYAARGWRIFPCHSFIDGCCTCDNPACTDPAKHPLTANGFLSATTDAELIRAWHEETQGLCNWALATGAVSGVWVLDTDGFEGVASLAEIQHEHGRLLETPTAQTGGGDGHFHRYFTHVPGVRNRTRFAPGLDVRGDGGYVLLPPSLHASGNSYRWLTSPDTPLAAAPAWLLALVMAEPVPSLPTPQPVPVKRPNTGLTLIVGAGTPDLTTSPGVGKGSRNATLCKLAGVHIARGEPLDDVEAAALAWGDRCSPPCSPKDVVRTVQSLWHRHHARATTTTHHLHLHDDVGDGVNRGGSGGSGSDRTGDRFNLFHDSTGSTGARTDSTGLTVSTSTSSAGATADTSADAWPVLHADSYHGLAGDITKAIGPETEADEVGVLLSLLACVGNAIGRGASFGVGTERHHANLFLCLCGDTASAKGQAWGIAKALLRQADPVWEKDGISYGLSSGEGLVDRVKDPEPEEGETVTLMLPVVKSLFCYESEFSRPITAMRREGNTLSPLLRSAWDSQPLEVLTRGKSRIKASNAHVSIIAHVTPEELRKLLDGSVEVANGFSNRFLWALVKRSKLLPHGGNAEVLTPFATPLADALAKAKNLGMIQRTDEANRLWESVYPSLAEARPGAFGKATERARPQAMRLALVYALLDGSDTIGVSHLRAALAVWRYCEASAKLIFTKSDSINNNTTVNTQESLAVRLLDAIGARPGVSRTELWDVAGHKVTASEMDQALAWLTAQHLAHARMDGDGRARCERWYCGADAVEEVEVEEVEPDSIRTTTSTVESVEEVEPKPDATTTSTSTDSTAPATRGPMPLMDLLAKVTAIGGRLVWRGGVIVVEAANTPDAITQAVAHHQAELALLVPQEPPKNDDEMTAEEFLKALNDGLRANKRAS